MTSPSSAAQAPEPAYQLTSEEVLQLLAESAVAREAKPLPRNAQLAGPPPRTASHPKAGDMGVESSGYVNPYASPKPAISSTRKLPETGDLISLLFSFKGRIPRRTYLGILLVVNLCTLSVRVITYPLEVSESAGLSDLRLFILCVTCALAMFISLAAQAKRWHDRNKSAWWVLFPLVPYVGVVWWFIECCCLRGSEGDNDYGADPT